jgi:hypothetical protein
MLLPGLLINIICLATGPYHGYTTLHRQHHCMRLRAIVLLPSLQPWLSMLLCLTKWKKKHTQMPALGASAGAKPQPHRGLFGRINCSMYCFTEMSKV